LSRDADVAAVLDFNFDLSKHFFPRNFEPLFRGHGWQYPLPYYLNSGVVMMRDTPKVHELCREWMKRWQMPTTLPHVWDQATLNSALFATGASHVVLPHGYNAQVVKRNYRFRSARILHFFGSPEEQRGTIIEHLLQHVERTGAFDDVAYQLAIRQRHPWGP